MGERGINSEGVWRAALAGVACGALVTFLFWLYFELTRPSAYSRLFALTFGPGLVLFGATAGLVFRRPRTSGCLPGRSRAP